jgi:class 3 adenylate cyclase
MKSVPAGTVTFLFTDIEGSTRLLQKLGDRYGELVAQHHRALRESAAASGGRRSMSREMRSSSPFRELATGWPAP